MKCLCTSHQLSYIWTKSRLTVSSLSQITTQSTLPPNLLNAPGCWLHDQIKKKKKITIQITEKLIAVSSWIMASRFDPPDRAVFWPPSCGGAWAHSISPPCWNSIKFFLCVWGNEEPAKSHRSVWHLLFSRQLLSGDREALRLPKWLFWLAGIQHTPRRRARPKQKETPTLVKKERETW